MIFPVVLVVPWLAAQPTATLAEPPALPSFCGSAARDAPLRPDAFFSERHIRREVEAEGERLLSDTPPGQRASADKARAWVAELSRCLSLTLFDEARWWTDVHWHEFAPQGQSVLRAFFRHRGLLALQADPVLGVRAPPPGEEPALPDAWIHAATHPVEYEAVTGELFRHGLPRMDAPLQGRVGDCYFLAAVTSLLERQPKLIEDTLRRNGDGTFSATFFEKDAAAATPTPITLTVDSRLPEAEHRLVGCRDRDRRELWPSVLEKLWAEFKGGYEYASSGLPPDAFLALTGRASTVRPVFLDSDRDALFRFLRERERHGDAMTADTYGTDALGHLDPLARAAVNGLLPDHAYSLLGTREDNGERFVLLRNPWGHEEPRGLDGRARDGVNDGRFELSLEEFVHAFAEVDALSFPLPRHASR